MNHVPRHSVSVPARVKAARVAVTGLASAAVGTGLAIASTGSAQAGGSVWDRVAACESGGNWAINTGNGFYGGLQFTRSTWLGFGGGQYASSAQYASRAQQIAVAQRVLAVQGPGAWPVCSVQAGLTRGNGGASSSATVSSSRSVTSRTAIVKRASAVSGSSVVRIQTRLGVDADGVIGPQTSRAIQRYVGVTPDGVIGPRTVFAMESVSGVAHSGASYASSGLLAAFAAYLANH